MKKYGLKRYGWLFSLVLAMALLWGQMLWVSAEETVPSAQVEDLSQANNIYVAYDDSGSMMGTISDPLDRWCRAKYALEIFSVLMQEKDEMKVYPLNEYLNDSGGYDYTVTSVSGSLSAAQRREVLEAYDVGCGMGTSYNKVQKAYEDLLADPMEGNKWLVILTDGDFDDTSSMPGKNLEETFQIYSESGVSVVFLRIFDGTGQNITVKTDAEKDIYVYTAKDSVDILSRINEISNLIFKRQAITEEGGYLQKSGDSITLNLDVPAEEIIVFAQGSGITIGDMSGTQSAAPAEKLNVPCPKRPPNGSNGKIKGAMNMTSEMLAVADLDGIIATFDSGDSVFQTGSYTIPVSDTSNITVYCKLAVQPQVQILQNEELLLPGDTLDIGEAEIRLVLVNPVTGEALDTSSGLLKDISYELIVNGQTENSSSVKMTLEEGTLLVSGGVRIGDSRYVLEDTQFTVKEHIYIDELAVSSCIVPDPGFSLKTVESGSKDQFIEIQVTEGGAPLSEERAAALQLAVTSDTPGAAEFTTEYVSDSTWKVYMSCPNPDALPFEKDTAQVPFTVNASLQIEDVYEEAAPYQATAAVINGSYIGQLEVVSCEMPEGGFDYEKLLDGSSKDYMTVTLAEDGEPLEEALAETLQMAVASDNGALSFTAEWMSGSQWKVTPVLTDPSNENAFTFTNLQTEVGFEITGSAAKDDTVKELQPYSGVLTLFVSESGMKIDFDGAVYDLETLPGTAADSSKVQPTIAELLDGDGRPLSEEDWTAVEVVAVDIVGKGGTILESTDGKNGSIRIEAVKGSGEHVSQVLIYPYSEIEDITAFRSKNVNVRVTLRCDYYGQTETIEGTGSFRVTVPWVWSLIGILKWLIPLLIIFAIVQRYIPRDYFWLPPFMGRMYGFKIRKLTEAYEDEWTATSGRHEIRNRMCTFTLSKGVIAFWKKAEWTVNAFGCDTIQVRVHDDGTYDIVNAASLAQMDQPQVFVDEAALFKNPEINPCGGETKIEFRHEYTDFERVKTVIRIRIQ